MTTDADRPAPSAERNRVRRGPCRTAALVFLAPCLAPPALAAQEDVDRRDPLRAMVELALTDASGNQNVSIVTAGFRLRYRPETWALELRLQGRYGTSRKEDQRERVAESYRAHLSAEVGPGDRWSPFVETAAEHDPFRRLDLRLNSGAGAKYRLFRDDDGGEALVSLALLHSYESISSEDEDPAPRSQNWARWSLRLYGQQDLNDGVTVAHSTQFQPVYDVMDDYLLHTETALTVMLTRRIALSLTYEFDRDSTPAEGVGRNDRLFKAGVMVRL